jgi:hypothetical protein
LAVLNVSLAAPTFTLGSEGGQHGEDRRGAVTGRTQFQRPDGHWQKRDEGTGQLMSVKDDGTPFKGVAKEPDGRDTDNA